MLSKIDVLIIEDDEDFCFLVENAIRQFDTDITIKFINNGQLALGYLKHTAETGVQPGMILLDLNLPGLSGLNLLREIKGIDFFRQVPVVLFTTSDSLSDKKNAAAYGATAFYTKPSGYTNLVNTLKSVFKDFLYSR